MKQENLLTAERLKQCRLSTNETLEQIATLTGVHKSTVLRWENGETERIKIATIKLLASHYNVNPVWLMGADVSMESELLPLPQDNIFMIPIYDSVAAGFGVIAQDCVVSYLPTFLTCSSEKDKYLWVNVKGDSMAPLIDDGSKILIKKQSSVDSGSIAVVLVDDEEAVVKKVIYGDNWVELHSTNPYYPPRRFEDNQLERIQVLGLVKEVSKTL